MPKDKPQIESARADWKDINGMIEEFEKALTALGLHIYDDPVMEGSDTYGFYISNQELTPEQIQDHSNLEWGQ